MVGRSVGRFRITSGLGSGGMATVWRAHDDLLRREVAVKILSPDLADSPEARRRFLREARSGAALDHPGIPAVLDFGESDGRVYMALALIDGETLSARAARHPLPIDEATRIVRDAARALAHAHDCGVIHRDITGRNIMVGHDGRVFLLDFGLSLAAGDSRITSSHTVIGTLTYLAPEVVRSLPAGCPSDLYGLGVVLFEALTGTMPFTGDRTEALVFAILNSDPPSPRARRPDIPPELEQIVLRAMARDPDRRFPDATSMAEALAPFAGSPDPGLPARERRSIPPPAAPASDAITRPWSARGTLHLAVLPFTSPTNADELLIDEIARNVGAGLGRLDGVDVVPPESAGSAGALVGSDPQRVAHQLGANLLLRAEVRRSVCDLRVSWSLIDPWKRAEVASGIVDGHDAAVFRLEDDLVAAVSRTLERDGSLARRDARPRDPAARERYAQAVRHLHRRDNEASVNEAIALLERLIESEGDQATLHATLGRAYLEKYEQTRNRMWENRAAAACQRALELDPACAESLIASGELHLAGGRNDQAIAALGQALRIDPGSVDALIGIARAQRARGGLRDAEQTLERAIRLQPRDWRVFNRLGELFFIQGRYAEATGQFRRAMELTPDNALAHSNLGSSLFQLDRLEDAVTALQRSIEVRPTARALRTLATVLFYLNRLEESADAYQRAAALTPSDPLVWGSLGSVRRWIPGQEAVAAEASERAVGIARERLASNPNDAALWASLAAWLANLGRGSEAIEAVEKALGIGPADVNVQFQTGLVYHCLGNRPKALEWFRHAVHAGYGVERLRRDPELTPLLQDPEFVRILDEGTARTRAGAEGSANPEEPHEG